MDVRCPCGEVYHADAANIGRRLRCRKCARELLVQAEPADPSRSRRRTRRSRRSGVSLGSRLREWLARLAPGRPAAARTRRSARPRTAAARTLHVASWAYLAAMLLVAALMWGLGDRWWPATALLFIGRWVFLLPLALLVPAALVARRGSLVPLALGALVAIGPIMGFRTGWRRMLPAPDGTPFRVVTFNVGGDVGAGRSVGHLLPILLVEWNADVVAFQECGQGLAAAVREAKEWHHQVDGALCLLSRHPIRESARMDRSALDRVRQTSDGAGGAGFVVRHTLETPGGAVDVTTLHLETPRKGFEGAAAGDLNRLLVNTDVRELESRLARRWVDAGPNPTLVVGDFNTTVESRIFREHWGDLADAFSRAGTGFGMTKYNGWIRVRIDHVLADDGWHVREARTGRGLGSDHRPLVVDLVLAAR